MTPVDVLFLVAAVAISLVGALRGVLVLRGRSAPGAAPQLTIALAAGVALVVLAPAVQRWESALVPSLGRLLSNSCALVAAYGLQHLALHVRFAPREVPRKARQRLVLLLVALAAMVGFFAASDPPTGPGLFGGLYRQQPSLAAYVLVYVLYLAVAVTDLAVLSLRSLRQTRRWLRAGMVLIAAGCVLNYGYLVQKVGSVVVELLADGSSEEYCTSPFATVTCAFEVGLPPFSVLAVIIGAALPSVGPQLERPVRAVVDWSRYRRLEPLAARMRATLPELERATPETPAEHLGERLYQRIIAVLDGMLVLQPHRSEADTAAHRQRARALPRRRRDAAVEAADLQAALRRRDAAVAGSGATPERPQHDDLAAETRWLVRVAREFSRAALSAEP